MRHRPKDPALDRTTANHPSPGDLVDKATKGRRARTVPLIEEIRPLVAQRLDALGDKPMAGL